MALHSALPHMLAALGAGQLEHKRVLLLAALQSGKKNMSICSPAKTDLIGMRVHVRVCECVCLQAQT